MSYSTIYNPHTGQVMTDGVQSQKVCDATLNIARSIAEARCHNVVVEDRGTRECCQITPEGERKPAPAGWVPIWDQDDE